MKILMVDCGVNRPHENYSAKHAKGYGGGACFGRFALILLNNGKDTFHILGPHDSFQDISEDENPHCCFPLDEGKLSFLRGGGNVRDVHPSIDEYDLVLYHHDVFYLNISGCKPKLAHWALMGDSGAQHPSCPNTLLYRPGEKNRYGNGYKIVIGKFVSSVFVDSPREDMIFCCGRADGHFNTIETAKFCLETGIKGVFAGPILDNYPLMDYIDGKTTFYLGLISEREKMEYTKRAMVTTYLHTWETAFNLSAVESLSVGTPIIAAKRGCFRYLLKEGINGFYWKPGDDLMELYEKCKTLDREKVWETAKEFSHTAMVNSFYTAFEKILRGEPGL